jgi:uncharacterized damage-inducible protein DinB
MGLPIHNPERTMNDPRYPIGRFQPERRPLRPEERAALIDSIAAHPANVRAAVAGLSDEQLDTPYREGGWTLRQVVHHVVDSHVNSYIRFKLAITEDHPAVRTYQQTLWAELPDGKSAPVDSSLAILDGLHDRWVRFLHALRPEDFARTMEHPEMGEVSVDFLLQLYGWHCPHHEGHITGLRESRGW